MNEVKRKFVFSVIEHVGDYGVDMPNALKLLSPNIKLDCSDEEKLHIIGSPKSLDDFANPVSLYQELEGLNYRYSRFPSRGSLSSYSGQALALFPTETQMLRIFDSRKLHNLVVICNDDVDLSPFENAMNNGSEHDPLFQLFRRSLGLVNHNKVIAGVEKDSYTIALQALHDNGHQIDRSRLITAALRIGVRGDNIPDLLKLAGSISSGTRPLLVALRHPKNSATWLAERLAV